MIVARSNNWQIASLWLVVIPFVLFSSMLLAVLPLYATALVLGIATLAIAVLVPMNLLMLTILVVGAAIGGSIEYFLGMAQVNWLPFLLAVIAGIRATAATVLGHQSTYSLDAGENRASLRWIAIPIAVYLSTLLTSSLLNAIPFTQAFAAIKNYLMMWGVLVAFVLGRPTLKDWRVVWRVMLAIAVLQLPFVLYQRIFIASRLGNTASSASFDAINGTFGGGLLGGRSGALAMFICIVLSFLLLCWRERRLSGTRSLVGALLILPTLFVIETKVIVIWLPLVVLLVFGTYIRRNPVTALMAVGGSVATVAAILVAYRYSYYADARTEGLLDFLLEKTAYIFDPERFNPATRELGRVSVLVHWWREMDLGNVTSWIVGFGPGTSRGASSLAIGEVARRYPFFIDTSAASVLLWDVGVLGFLSFVAMIVGGVLVAWRALRFLDKGSEARVQTEAASIALLLILSDLFYTKDAVDGPIIQFVMFAALAQIISHAAFAAQPQQDTPHGAES